MENIIIIGSGPSGLTTAILLKVLERINSQQNESITTTEFFKKEYKPARRPRLLVAPPAATGAREAPKPEEYKSRSSLYKSWLRCPLTFHHTEAGRTSAAFQQELSGEYDRSGCEDADRVADRDQAFPRSHRKW